MKLVKVPDWLAKLPGMGKYVASGIGLKKSESPKDSKTISIVQEFTNRSAQNIETWRTGLDEADNPETPRWASLQDLYDYLMVDTHTHSQIELRKAATLSNRFYVYDTATGEESAEKTALLNKQWFYNFLSNVLDARIRGYAVAQLINPVTMEFFYVPHRNVVIQQGLILEKVQGDKGIFYKQDKAFAGRMIEVIDEYQFGYFNDLVPQIFWKRNAQQSWAEFSEKYGMPGVIAVSNKTDTKTLDSMEAMLKTFGESLTGVVPHGTEIKVLEFRNGADGHKVYDQQIERCNSEISKRIIGGTMVSDDGSSRSQSEVHERNLDDKIAEADKRLCEFTVNDQLLPMMRAFGWKFSETDAVAFDRSTQIDIKQHWEIVSSALDKFDIDEDWIKRTFQIPIIGKKKVETEDKTTTVKGFQKPKADFNKASIVMATALEAAHIRLPKYDNTCGHNHTPVASGFIDKLMSVLSDKLLNEIWQGKDTLTTEVLKSIATHKTLLDGLYDGWSDRMMDITYDAPDNHCLAAMEYNLFEFSRLKEKANVFVLNQMLIDKDKNNIRSFEDFKNLALPYLDNADIHWLKTEYAQAIAVGQNASRWHQFYSEKDTITKWVEWQTVGDSRVRQEHSLLDGKIFNLEDNGLTIWPPKDWGCRCEMVQYLGKPPVEKRMTNAEGMQTLGLKAGDKWNVNRGVVEQVFTANEMYTKAEGLFNEAGKLDYNTYGLSEHKKMKGLSKLKIDNTITEDNVDELWKPVQDKDYMGYDDYLGRKITLPKSTFTKHTTGYYLNEQEQRHQLFPHITEALTNPDEVYMFDFKVKVGKVRPQLNFLKFYKDELYVVNVELGKKNLNITTWYKADVDEKHIRKGYLLHQKNKP